MSSSCAATVRLSDGAVLWTATGGATDRDAPAMVFLHGGAGMWDNLGPVAVLAPGPFRTHRYDQRGCGRSSPNEEYSLARSVGDLEELREHWEHERWYVFGHSFGATLGLEYAASHPERVAGLVYCSGQGLGWSTHRRTYQVRKRERLGRSLAARLDELAGRSRNWDDEVEWRTLSWLPDFADRDRAHEWARDEARTPLPLNLTCNRAMAAETRTRTAAEEDRRLRQVRCPVWVVHGDGDPRPVEGPRALAAALATSVVHELAGAGHQPWRERPDLVADVLAVVADHAEPDRPPGPTR